MTDIHPLPSQPLPDSTTHIWCASLSVSATVLAHYSSCLALDEKARAARFYFEVDRNRYITGRGLLRTILGSYLQLEPAQIEFVYGPYGKPTLKPAQGNKPLEFNLSHSKDLVVYAFNWNRILGVDVEYIKPMPDMDSFAQQYFSPRETAFINALSGEEKEQAFFKLWTGKEAFLKANGSGLIEPLNEVEVSLETWKTFALNASHHDKPKTEQWHLEMFNPVPGYQAALVLAGHADQIVFTYLEEDR